MIHALNVTFVDGEAEVSDKNTTEALRRLPAELGVRAAGGRPSAASGKSGKTAPI
ncbi:hypothetical protein F4560_001275 [Saccharothrix ecbatanensis]|uniref:Uncharacterized protein n=1 Tax=Saccharothrix ecbatanensis TaxID=1105145 RepID=A0A7W9LZA8_9PSEU|nr:hypothetical protein [Saccharothrix ecbatanensis]MBB5801507.1 hypothetical protein [Saccharothrix ecbatanensis]